jgi:arginine decarboxylase
LMSISIAIAQMNLHGRELLEAAIHTAGRLRTRIQAIDGLRCFELTDILNPSQGICGLDPLRITVDVTGWGLHGYEVARCLVRQEGIVPELATWNQVLFTLSPFDSEKQASAVVTALQRLALTRNRSRRLPGLPALPLTEQRYSPREAYYHPRRRWLPLKQAVGKTSGETISTYPPGIPVLVEGEAISEDVLVYMDMVRGAGGTLKGTSDPTIEHIWIIED